MTSVPVKQTASRPTLQRVRPRRDFGAMEERCMRAGDLFEQDVRPAEIARQVGVSHQVVADWRAAWLVWLALKLVVVVVVVASGHLERPAAKALTAAETLTGIE